MKMKTIQVHLYLNKRDSGKEGLKDGSKIDT